MLQNRGPSAQAAERVAFWIFTPKRWLTPYTPPETPDLSNVGGSRRRRRRRLDKRMIPGGGPKCATIPQCASPLFPSPPSFGFGDFGDDSGDDGAGDSPKKGVDSWCSERGGVLVVY
eukprot:gene9630-biopygen6132